MARPTNRAVPATRILTPSFKLVVFMLLALMALGLMTIGRSYAQRQPAARAENPVVDRTMDVGRRKIGPRRIDYDRVDDRLKALMRRAEMVGLGIAIIENGELSYVKGYGTTVAGGAERVTPQTVFRWASVSKGVAGTLVGLLADRGKLRLDDPISRWSTTLKLPNGGESVATVADVMSHRTGVVKNAYDDKLEGGEDPKAIRRLLGKLPPYCKPHSCFAYQNIAFDAASEVVERATGRGYGVVAREELFGPLGMSSATTTRLGLTTARSWARPHQGRSPIEVKEAYYRVPAAGGVNSSVFDLGLWTRAQMGRVPSVIPLRVLDRIHAPLVSTPRRGAGEYDRVMTSNSYGLGWREHSYQGHRLVGHRGAVAGYRSLVLFDPTAQVGVAMLWNSSSVRPTGFALEVLDMYYRLPAKDWLRLADPK